MTGPSRELQSLKADFFRTMAHPARIRILEVLSGGELSVQALQEKLSVDQPAVSQQLAKLRAHGVVTGRKEGTTVIYALADPRIADLLNVAKDILNRRLSGSTTLLHELQSHG